MELSSELRSIVVQVSVVLTVLILGLMIIPDLHLNLLPASSEYHWVNFELGVRLKYFLLIFAAGIIAAILGIRIEQYSRMLKPGDQTLGWKLALLNDLFLIEGAAFLATSVILYIRILWEDWENLEIELLRYMDLAYPLLYIAGLLVHKLLRRSGT